MSFTTNGHSKSAQSAAALYAGGAKCKELFKGGYTVDEAKTGGYSLQEIRAAGYTEGYADAGIPIHDVHEELKFTLSQIKTAGYMPSDIKHYHHYTLEEVRKAGFVEGLKVAGWTTNEAKVAGYTPKELHDGGYSIDDLYLEGFEPYDCSMAGCAGQPRSHDPWVTTRPTSCVPLTTTIAQSSHD